MPDHDDDFITQAARRVRAAIDGSGVIPADGKQVLRDLAGRAEHAVQDRKGAMQDLAGRVGQVVQEGRDALQDITGAAEHVAQTVADTGRDVAESVADTGRDVAETVALVAMETTDLMQQRYRRRTRIVNAVGAGVIVVLVVALIGARRR